MAKGAGRARGPGAYTTFPDRLYDVKPTSANSVWAVGFPASMHGDDQILTARYRPGQVWDATTRCPYWKAEAITLNALQAAQSMTGISRLLLNNGRRTLMLAAAPVIILGTVLTTSMASAAALGTGIA